MQVSDDHFGVRARANRLRMIADGGLVDHVAVSRQSIAKRKPPVLEVVIDHLALELFSSVLNLLVNPARQRGNNGLGRAHQVR